MNTESLDVNEFMERVQNDKELFFELLDIFLKDFSEKRIALGKALESKDYQTIEHVAHFLKGSCGNISAGTLRKIFSELEQKGRESSIENGNHYLNDIDQNFEELVRYIGELRAKLS